MDSDRRKGPVCGVENCRSRIYDEGEDGYRYCENGHQKGDLVVGLDEDNFTAEARVRTRKKKDHDDDEQEHKYFKGQQAYDLYLKSLQLIIRHQVWFLIHEKSLPAELETVVLDLWTLRILQLEGKVSNEREGYDSQSQAESDIDSERELPKSMRGKKLESTPTLLDSLALCYLGIITLRLPITLGDIYTWVIEENMPYKRAIKHIPPAMKDRLPAHYKSTLNPNATLNLERFYSAVIDLQVSFEKKHGVIWPSLNYPLLLFRYLKELCLPLELYDASIRLASILEYDFMLHTGNARLSLRQYPEAQLLACLVVCVKLMYPFDGKPRYAKTTSEPASTTIDWEVWYKEISASRIDESGGIPELTSEALTNAQEKDVLLMTGNQLDQYLDWYQESFIDESSISQSENGDFRNALYNMFPIDTESSHFPVVESQQAQKRLEVVKAVHGTIKPGCIVADGEDEDSMLRPGQDYVYYKKEKDLPEPARRFYEAAARISGLPLEMLVNATFFAEMKVKKRKGQLTEGDDEEHEQSGLIRGNETSSPLL